MTSHANVGVGTLALTHPSTGTVKCRTVAGVETENPSGARHGSRCRGLWTRGPTCETAGGKAELVPEKLPWTSILIEEAPLFRDKLTISKASRYG